jgi:hypothetical protein
MRLSIIVVGPSEGLYHDRLNAWIKQHCRDVLVRIDASTQDDHIEPYSKVTYSVPVEGIDRGSQLITLLESLDIPDADVGILFEKETDHDYSYSTV